MAARAAQRPRGAAIAAPAVLQPLMVGLAAAAAVELVLLRTFTRTAIHIPALQSLTRPYEVLSDLGQYSYYVAAVLALTALPIAGVALWRRESLSPRVAAGALLAFAAVAAAARAGLADRLTLDTVTIAVVIVIASALASGRDWRATVVVGAFATAFVLSGGHTALQTARTEGGPGVDAGWLLSAAEYTGVAFALASPLLVGAAPSRRLFACSAGAGMVIFVGLLGNGSTPRILLLWNEGLSGTLPSVVYAVAGGALVAAFAGLLGRRQVLSTVGLVLLVAGGIGLHNTYQTALAVVGLAAIILATGERKPREAAPAASR